MNAQAQDQGALTLSQAAAAKPPAEERERGVPANSVGLDPTSLAEAAKVADLMSRSKQGVPKPFRAEPGLCFAVVCQAMAWRMNPFQVASQAYVVNDQVAYMAQIMKAAVDMHAPLDEPLDIQFEGSGQDRFARVIGKIVTRSGKVVERVYESPPIRAIPVKNSPLWKNDPDQQLGYYAVRSWARRHCPGVLSGVYEAEEIKHSTINAREPAKPLEQRLAEAAPMRIDFANKDTTPADAPVGDTSEDEAGDGAEEGGGEDPAPPPSEAAEQAPSPASVIGRAVLKIAEAKDADAANAVFDALEQSEAWAAATDDEKEPARKALAAKLYGDGEGE